MRRARYASPEGTLVTPEEFITRATPLYRERHIFPYCPSCGERLDLYGLHSPNVASRFDHTNLSPNTDPLDDCILANRNSRFLEFEPDDWDDEAGKKLRTAFFQEENLCQTYAFCLELCRKRNLPIKLFRSMIRRADRKNIWSYAEIKLWVIPYVLLTLDNFVHIPKDVVYSYDFHFILEKPKGTTISALWRRPGDCRLKKVFSNSGQPVKANDNPFRLSEAALKEKAGNFKWIKTTGSLLRELKACE